MAKVSILSTVTLKLTPRYKHSSAQPKYGHGSGSHLYEHRKLLLHKTTLNFN